MEHKWHDKIIEGIVDGDIFTYRSLYDLYYEKLCNYAYIYVCDTYDAENIVSDVFLNVWERRRTLGDVKNINSYLYAAVRNRAINHLKRYSFNRELQFSKMENNPLNSVADDVTSLPLECLMASELEKRIHGFIESLPPQTKMVMNLKRNENKTYEEIAELLDISVNTVKYHIKRALRLLRGELNDYMNSKTKPNKSGKKFHTRELSFFVVAFSKMILAMGCEVAKRLYSLASHSQNR